MLSKGLANELLKLDSTKANTNNAVLTGTPTVPTATLGTSTMQAASTAFVQNAIKNAIGSFKVYIGPTAPSSASLPPLTSADNGKYIWFCTETGNECIKLYINDTWTTFGAAWK